MSDEVSRSIPEMRIFLVTGIFGLWPSMFLINTGHRRQVFDWFCCGCLAIIVPVEIIFWLIGNYYSSFQIFTLHPIPLGTLIILLSPGPIHLLVSKSFKVNLFSLLLVSSSLMLIFVTHKRSTWIALTVMLVLAIVFLTRRRRCLLATLLVVAALILSVQAKRFYDRLDPSVNRYASVLQRVELYNFALHIWETHPLMGIGLRPLTHARYLKDYHQYNKNLIDFSQSVAKLQTLDNMVLTAIVELGSLMTLAYLGLVIVIMVRYGRALWSTPATSFTDWYRMLVLVGLAIHSMSYDSLLFPPVNWIFHIQLGIMAGYQTAEKALGSEAGLRHVIT
ncbi:MAG: O-antigen ligase family protein [Desulfobaccales bacterium]